jgi:tetratricopeptide (TPR) repeat protein
MKYTRRVRLGVLLIAALVSAPFLSAQQKGQDFNEFYRFPLSVGVFYQSLTSLAAYNTPYTIFDAGAEVRIPVPGVPVLQPFLRLGYMGFDSIDSAFPTKWDHFHLYGTLGAAYVNRFSRNFEYALEASAGFSEAVFPRIVDTGTVASPYLLFGVGGRLGLEPSYNFSVEFQPSARYLLSLSPLKTFDGFVFSVGLTASYRLGEDPDSARAIIRALRMENLSFGPAFSAMQSYYADNPLGTVTITNTEKQPLSDLKVSFLQPGYMDGETPGVTIPSLKPGESTEVSLKAVFNGQVFTTEGKTPLTGQVVTRYRIGGRDVEQREPVSYVLYDKTAITWGDDRKVGAFITPQDSSLKAWTAAVSEAARDGSLPALNQPLQIALQVYQSLAVLGIQYQEDPSSPFTRVQGKVEAVDSVNLPRTTLRQRYGDCDDLTVLFASLLETRSIHTAFITVPGHIYAAFDTGVPADSFADVHPDRGMTIALRGTVWIPVEVTLLDGRSDFMSAWQRGIELWNQFPKERAFTATADAQAVYAPVGLQEALIQPTPPAREAILKSVAASRERLADAVIRPLQQEAQKSKGKREYNRLGLAAARFGRYPQAIEAFTAASRADPSYATAQVNLGNGYFYQKDYRKAAASYSAALALLKARGADTKGGVAAAVLANLAQVSRASGDTKAAQDYMNLAIAADPQRAGTIPEAGGSNQGTARAASAADRVILVDDEQ